MNNSVGGVAPFNAFENARTNVRLWLKQRGYEPNELQLKFRDGFWDRNLAELAICDALIEQGSIQAHPGDGVGCVAQMIEAQVRRAEKAEAEVERLRGSVT